jgi:hypothetical protein
MTFLEQLQADWLFYMLNVLGFVVVVATTWLLVRSKQANALAALQEQQATVDLAANTVFLGLQEKIDKEREYLRRSVQLLEQALRSNDLKALREHRYQLIHSLLQNYRPKVMRQTQLWQHHYQNNPSQQQLLAKQMLVPFLETCRQVIAAINAKAVLEQLPANSLVDEAFVGEEQEFEFAFQALKNCGRTRWAKQYRNALALEATPNPA